MTTELVKTEGKQTLAHALDRLRPYLLAVLPKHLDPDRMLKLALLCAQKQPLLKQCTLESVTRSVMYVAQLGLEIGRTAHLVPFRNGKTGDYECQMIPDYRGLIDLAERSGRVTMVDAEVVYACDTFIYERGTTPQIVHKPKLDGERTIQTIIAFYAVALRTSGDRQFVVVTKSEVDAVRARSRASSGGPWVTDYVAMGKKTAVKRLSSYLPMSPEMSAAIELDNRFESGEVSTVSTLLDTEESLTPEATKGAVALKGALAKTAKPDAVPAPDNETAEAVRAAEQDAR